MQLIITEKPSVARDLARALGVRGGGQGCIEGGDRVITWCLGHLVEFDEPDAYDPAWKPWRLASLPMLPEVFRLRPVRSSASQWKVVRGLLRDRRFDEVVNACDAGREGEHIFRLCVELAGARAPVRRLWISSLTEAAIRDGFGRLEPAARYDALGDAARCRAEADWLVGINATRAVTVRGRSAGSDALFSVGRVQTPTLAMLVARDQAIRAFVPKDYWEIAGAFTTAAGVGFTARWGFDGRQRLARADVAQSIIARASEHVGPPSGPRVESIETKRQRVAPPMLFDLTSLQRTANGRYGFSAQRTLDLAQALYEKHKVLTYPRTDSRHLQKGMHAALPQVLRAVGAQPEYAAFAERLLASPLHRGSRVFDDGKVRDHHAIIPTEHRGALHALSSDERRLFDLVTRRFLGAFYPDAEFDQTVAVLVVGPEAGAAKRTAKRPPREGEQPDDDDRLLDAAPPPPDRFVARGRVRVTAGWQEVAGFGDDEGAKSARDDAQALPPLAQGERLGGRYAAEKKQTQAPRRYNDATLLGAMESAGRQVDDEALREALKDRGLGTPATRASMIETLIARGYAAREQKALASTPLGEALIDGLPVPALASAELTGAWEERLARVARGEESREAFMRDIREVVRDLVRRVSAAPGIAAPGSARARPPRAPAAKPMAAQPPAASPAGPAPALGSATGVVCPVCSTGTLIVGRRAWGCSRWKEGCGAVFPFEAGLPEAKAGARAKRARKAGAAAPKPRRKRPAP
jgi:DNA topoisomerase III